jgi:hypothetical protein
MSDKSIVGDLINFRGLVYAPINENGVIFLFGKIADDLNMYIEEIKPGYPDCIGRRFMGKGWERVAIEFEFRSSNFKQHKHNEEECDIIICWENDWKNCPIEVIELKTEIQELDNYLVARPKPDSVLDSNGTLEDLFKNSNSSDKVIEWYNVIFTKLKEYNVDIWAKVGTKYIGWYSPAKSFVSVKPASKSIKFECYSGKESIPGAIITNKKFSPNWSKFFVKDESEINNAVNILIESHKKIVEALVNRKITGYFSDGEQFGTAKEIIENEEYIE